MICRKLIRWYLKGETCSCGTEVTCWANNFFILLYYWGEKWRVDVTETCSSIWCLTYFTTLFFALSVFLFVQVQWQRDRETGLSTMPEQHKVLNVHELSVAGFNFKMATVELICDQNTTPWCLDRWCCMLWSDCCFPCCSEALLVVVDSQVRMQLFIFYLFTRKCVFSLPTKLACCSLT